MKFETKLYGCGCKGNQTVTPATNTTTTEVVNGSTQIQQPTVTSK